MAEGLFYALVSEAGLADRIKVESAGTSHGHQGRPPDPRSIEQAAIRGIHLEGSVRQIVAGDLAKFDHILAMDLHNLADVLKIEGADNPRGKIQLLRDFDPANPDRAEVEDPYFGGPEDYERAWNEIDAACRGLLSDIRATLQIAD